MSDTSAIADFVTEHGPALSRLCAGLCGNRTDAEDLYQDTWLKAIRFYHSYDPARPFDKWLFAIAVNSFKNLRLSAWARKRYEFPLPDEKQRFLESIPDKTTPAGDYEHLQRCVAKLPERLRTVLVLKYVSGYSEADLAQLLRIPVGTVKSRLHSAKQILKGQLS